MTIDRRLSLGLSALATSAVVVVGVGLPGPIGELIVLAFVFIGPGLAATLLMGPMGAEARALVALAGSVVLGVLVSVAMVFTDTWSALLGIAALAIFTQTCVIVAARRHVVARVPRSGRDGQPSSAVRAGKETEHG